MIQRVTMKYVAVVLIFTFCQVIGSMCTLPNLSMAEESATMVEEHVACPMDDTVMCPPSLTSSSVRQLKNSDVTGVNHATILLSLGAMVTVLSAPTQCFRSNVSSIVPLSIDSSPVLRI